MIKGMTHEERYVYDSESLESYRKSLLESRIRSVTINALSANERWLLASVDRKPQLYRWISLTKDRDILQVDTTTHL